VRVKKKLLRLLLYLSLFFFLWGGTTPAALGNNADAVTPEIVDLQKEIDLSRMDQLLQELDKEIASLEGFTLRSLFQNLKEGNLSLNPQDIGKRILAMLGREIVENGPLIAKLLTLAVLCAVLGQLQASFEGEVGKIARYLAYLVLFSMTLSAFKVAVDAAGHAIDRMVELMQALLPAMLTLLLAMGNLATAALFKPFILGSLAFLATLLKNIVLPLFFLAAILNLLNYISDQYKLNKFAGLLEFGGKFVLGLVMTVFLGVMTIHGATGGVADGVALRTAKYSADLIPVIGKYFKDAMELVVSSGLLLKNALHIIGLIAVAIICLTPLLKIVSMLIVFKVSAAIIEPLGEKTLADSLQTVSQSLLLIFATMACVGLMFFITIAVVAAAGNYAVMLR